MRSTDTTPAIRISRPQTDGGGASTGGPGRDRRDRRERDRQGERDRRDRARHSRIDALDGGLGLCPRPVRFELAWEPTRAGLTVRSRATPRRSPGSGRGAAGAALRICGRGAVAGATLVFAAPHEPKNPRDNPERLPRRLVCAATTYQLSMRNRLGKGKESVGSYMCSACEDAGSHSRRLP